MEPNDGRVTKRRRLEGGVENRAGHASEHDSMAKLVVISRNVLQPTEHSDSTSLAPHADPVSTVARQTLKAAFEDLDRTITPSDSCAFRATTIKNVRDAAIEIERQLAARGSLRNMRRLMPLFKGLENYSKVMDVLCHGTPYLPWIWAPITLILRVASEHVEAFEQIIKGYAQLAESLVRFEILDSAFKDNHHFQQTLAVFYADILQFHKHAYKFVRRSGKFISSSCALPSNIRQVGSFYFLHLGVGFNGDSTT